ncbi:unnamed protein product [Mytilus coruscus]|uniref:DZIP3-like HEPN domain-containing protein n=1 Tax=Mytilus coruscus TaxID=42192 RepID=A0A6J8DJK8_MYTCO|nr:unnamed protein product [Mytilus coruscus]
MLIFTAVRLKREEHQPVRNSELTTDEVNYLRMIHLLVRVACPVVRMYFDKEIQPDQLRKTLDKYRSEMVTRYRKKDTIINDSQWSLLYGPYIGQKVTSNDFDIRLMTYLLSTLAHIEVGDVYPVYSNTSIHAMLSRIQLISNETLRNFEGKLSGYKFNKNWDCIGQTDFLC